MDNKAQQFDNVWDALEFGPAERANLKPRSALMIDIGQFYKKSGLAQKEAAK